MVSVLVPGGLGGGVSPSSLESGFVLRQVRLRKYGEARRFGRARNKWNREGCSIYVTALLGFGLEMQRQRTLQSEDKMPVAGGSRARDPDTDFSSRSPLALDTT